MNPKTICKIAFFIISLMPLAVKGQISQGGSPIKIQRLMSFSGDRDLVVMPGVDNQKMQKTYNSKDTQGLKPLRFAHAFNVSLTPDNSGIWYNTSEINVWQLRIRSEGAYSLNFILEKFHLPAKARLFLINEKTGAIKGAYTSDNNSESNVLAIEPIAGDEILIQYEEPVNVSFPGKFCIAKVAHDFVGIMADSHRPLGISGSCNVNVNCDLANGTENIRDAVCRIIVAGEEICSGTMINNTKLDGTPYVLTAYHCIGSETNAQSSIFLFNYESPYCLSIDGDVSRSLSGSSLKASNSDLDYTLVRLNTTPPYNYRTYLAGWNRKNQAPSSSMCISHPMGDIKKIAIDNHEAVSSTYENYASSGFWKILRWDTGVTEAGSSGGPLFDQDKLLVGSLTGGDASCSQPVNDYFAKFALVWNYGSGNQLKTWLDPLNTDVERLDGMFLYSGKSLCIARTNFKDDDTHTLIRIKGTPMGYWSGSNPLGYTDFAEQFKNYKSCDIQGVTLGVAKVKTNASYANSYINVNVYDGTDKPEALLYSEKFDIRKFYADAMNYLPFKNSVKTEGSFFISYDISQLNPGDTLAIYQASGKADRSNSFFLKNTDGWGTYNSLNTEKNGSALLAELIACNVDDGVSVDEFETEHVGARFFPNPLSGNSLLNVQTSSVIDCPESITVFDLAGKRQNIQYSITGQNTMTLNFSGKMPGIYFVRFETSKGAVVGKIAYVP